IPRPSPPADVWGFGIDVGRRDVGLHLVAMHAGPRAGAVDGIQDREELVGLVAVAERGEGHHRPDGRVGVLAAVLADSRRVALDLAGGEGGVIEWRGGE